MDSPKGFFNYIGMKETFYFSHDYNATQDPKLMSLLSTCGLSGVGMYWILIEILHQQTDSRILFKSYEDYIEFYCRIDEGDEQVLNNIKQMLINVGLLVKDGDYVFSERVLKNKKERERLSELRSLAGKKSAEIRQKSTLVEHPLNKGQQGKERKGKEIKEKDIYTSHFVPPTYEEVKKYCDEKQNQIDAQKFIDFYQSKGWVVGKTKMKDWKACIRTWERSEKPKTNNRFTNILKI